MRQHQVLKARARHGVSLAVVLLVLTLILVIGFGLTSLSIQSLNLANADGRHRTALYAAESGLADSCVQLKANAGWSAGFNAKAMPSISATYTVTVVNNVGGSADVVAGDGVRVPLSCVYLISEGRMGSAVATVRALYQVAVGGGFNPFTYAAFAVSDLSLKGNATVDSYDSTKGGYSSSANQAAGHDEGADIGTNANDDDPVTFNSHAANYGYVWFGPGITQAVATALYASGGGGAPSLGARVLTTPVSSTPLVSPVAAGTEPGPSSGTIAPGGYTSLNVTGTAQLQAGDYYFPDGITVSGTLLAPASGVARLYFGGTLNFKSGVIGSNNGSSNPAAIQMLGTKDAVAVTGLGGGSSVATMVVFAPTADIDVQSSVAGYYGSLVGKTVKIQSNGVGAHYDRHLLEGGASLPSQSSITRILWKRD